MIIVFLDYLTFPPMIQKYITTDTKFIPKLSKFYLLRFVPWEVFPMCFVLLSTCGKVHSTLYLVLCLFGL